MERFAIRKVSSVLFNLRSLTFRQIRLTMKETSYNEPDTLDILIMLNVLWLFPDEIYVSGPIFLLPGCNIPSSCAAFEILPFFLYICLY